MSVKPRLSVIIPAYNDPEGLQDTLNSLINQQDTPKYEIVVVDNDSTDETPSVIDEFEAEYPGLVFGYSERDMQSSYAARNTGIEEASGDIIAFLDADMTVDETWVRDICQCFEELDVDYLGCNVEMYIPNGEDTFWARYDVAMGLPVKHYLETKRFAPTCALTVRREVFDVVDTFDQTLVSGGDKEFGRRVHDAGLMMGYTDQIVVRHPARSTFQAHVKKAARIGRGQVQLWREYDLAPHPLSPVRFLPPNPFRVRNRQKENSNFLFIYISDFFFKIIQTVYGIYYR